MSARSLGPASGEDDSKSEDGTSVDGTDSCTNSSTSGAPELPFFDYNYRHQMSMNFYDKIIAHSGDKLREKKLKTGLHLEMHKEMVQATFTLMKRVVLADGPIGKLECRRHELTVEDFRRAYNLVHDWYPQLLTVGPAYQEIWRQSKVEMLQALSRLARQRVLEGQEAYPDFEAWVDTELAVAVLQEEENGRLSRYHPMHDESRVSVLRAACHHNLLAMHALMSQGETRTHQHAITNFTKGALRLLYMVLVTDAFVLYESSCLGLLMQFFLDINIQHMQHMGDFIFQQWHTVVSAPIAVIMAAACGTNFLELTRDALNDPPFKLTCAHFLVVGETVIQHHGRVRYKTWWRMFVTRGVDFFFTYWLGLLICLGGLKWGTGVACSDSSIRQRGFMNGYMHGAVIGALVWVTMAWILYVLCWLYNSLDCSQRRFATTSLMHVLTRCIQGYGIRPGTYTRFFLTISRHLELADQDEVAMSQEQILKWVDKETQRSDGWKEYAHKLAHIDGGLHTRRHCEGCFMALGTFVMWPFVYGVFVCGLLKVVRGTRILRPHNEHVVSVWLCSILVLVAVLVTGGFVCRLMPKLNTMGFRSHVLSFGLVSVLMTCLSTFVDWADTPPLSVIARANETGGFYNDPYKESQATLNPYPVCSNIWGQSNSKVDIIDLGLLSWYAYEEDPERFEHLVNATFVTPVITINVTDIKTIPRVAIVRIPDSNAPNRGTVVIAVKGTSTMAEAFADMGMYTTMVSLQVADKIAPLLHTFPTSIIAQAIGATEIPFSRKTSQKFVEDLGDHVERAKAAFPNHRIVLTGHSLGGGLAEVAGSRHDVPAVVFSAPGNVFLTKALGIPKPRVYKNIIGVMPDDDVVPSIDDHADMVQHIQCMDAKGEARNSLGCHGMLVTLCELWRVCGDRYRRDFYKTCVNDTGNVHPNCVGHNFGEGEGEDHCPR